MRQNPSFAMTDVAELRRLVDLNPWVCPTESACPPVIDQVLLFRQGSHLTATYVRSLTPVLHHALVTSGVARTPLDEIDWEVPPDASGG